MEPDTTAIHAAAAAAPRILVLMATFNGARWISDQVLSIAAQQGVVVTLAICDDNSADDTLSLARRAGGDSLRVEVVEPTQPGGSAAKNFFRLMEAVDPAGQDFVALADQDDLWEPGKLARAAERLRASDAVGYSATVRAFWPNGRVALLSQRPTPTLADYVFEGAGQGCTFVMRADHFASLQRLLALHRDDLRALHYHDWTLYALSRSMGRRWLFDDWVCMQYRQHAENDTGARTGTGGIHRRLELIRSGWYGAQTRAIARLCVSVSGEAATGAVQYLRRTEVHDNWRRSLSVCAFALRHGRRRWLDRLVLAWAALSGYLP
jgi:rhamnosyltransferase